MIVSRIRDKYQSAKVSAGNPTGSRFGTCAAQLQQALYPAMTCPEPIPPRRRMVMNEGRRIEAWIKEEISEILPASFGLEEQPFYYPIPLPAAEADRLRRRIQLDHGLDGRVWGSVFPGFIPPKIEWPEGQPIRYRGLHEAARGIILDPDTLTAWFPIYVDGVMRHPSAAMSIVEIKSMSNLSFRRAVMGNMGYGHRCQMYGAHLATGLNVVWILYRKETSHLAEVTMDLRLTGRTKISLDRGNGRIDVLYTRRSTVGDDEEPPLMNADGEPVVFPDDDAWDAADVAGPFNPALGEEISARIRSVLMVEPEPNGQGPDGRVTAWPGWAREYGPSFLCENCDGVGAVRCGYCDGTTISKRSKTGKTCGACVGGKRECGSCEGTKILEEVALPQWPCNYCATWAYCYPMAELQLSEGKRPRMMIRRADYDVSGLSFTRPASLQKGS